MKIITQKECLEVLDKTPYPRGRGDLVFVMRFMFKLNELAKERGYRLFHWTEYCIQDEQIIGSWIISNIEPLSKEIIEKTREPFIKRKMCKLKKYKDCNVRIDKCLKPLIKFLEQQYNVVACCCGHNKYPITVVVQFMGKHYELFCGVEIPRKRKFYKRDKQGYYYIPETLLKSETKSKELKGRK